MAPPGCWLPRPAVGVWNAETGTCRASAELRLTQQPQAHGSRRSSPRGPLAAKRTGALPKTAASPTVPWRGEGGGKKGLLTHRTRGLRSLNGLQRKLKGNKDGSPVSADAGAGHLFADRPGLDPCPQPPRAPRWRPPAPSTTSPSKGGLLSRGGLPARSPLTRSQRQRSLMIKHWAPPASFASTARMALPNNNNDQKLRAHPARTSREFSPRSPHCYPLSVYYYHSYFTSDKVQEQRSHRLEVTPQESGRREGR